MLNFVRRAWTDRVGLDDKKFEYKAIISDSRTVDFVQKSTAKFIWNILLISWLILLRHVCTLF